jgi:regulator of nonsense transcripts 2
MKLAGDKEHINLPILLTVLKVHGRELTGIAPRKSKVSGDGKDSEAKPPTTDEGSSAPDNTVAPAQQQLFKTMFVEYYKGLENHLVRDHKVGCVKETSSMCNRRERTRLLTKPLYEYVIRN